MSESTRPTVCWIYDPNLRIYRRDEFGRSYGRPIFIKSWRKTEITGETKLSWVASTGLKIPKKNPPKTVFFSWEDVQRAAYVADHRTMIVDRVRDCSDVDILHKIAELVGYTTEDEEKTTA